MPPKTRPAKIAATYPLSTDTDALAPAPDNGQHYAMQTDIDTRQRARTDEDRAKDRARDAAAWGRKLSNRVPRELYEQLEQRAKQLGLSVSQLIVDALRAEVSGMTVRKDLASRVDDAAARDGITPDRVVSAAVEAELTRRSC